MNHEDQMPFAIEDRNSHALRAVTGSDLSPVTLEISFESLLGKRAADMSEDVRQARWEAWKKLAPDVAEYWQPDPETCGTCKHLRGDWCELQALPAAVNPILSYQHGMPGMACMGAGHDRNTESRDAGGAQQTLLPWNLQLYPICPQPPALLTQATGSVTVACRKPKGGKRSEPAVPIPESG